MDDLNRPGPTTTDPYNQTTRPVERSSGFSSMYLILGALVVAVAVLAFAFSGDDTAQDGRAGTEAPVTETAPEPAPSTAPSMAPTAPSTAPDTAPSTPPAGAPSPAPAQ